MIHGTKYKGGCIVHVGYDHFLPKFAVVRTIYVKAQFAITKIFFVVQDLVSECAVSHFHSYRVTQYIRGNRYVVNQSDFATFLPLHGCHPFNQDELLHIVPKFSLDVLNLF